MKKEMKPLRILFFTVMLALAASLSSCGVDINSLGSGDVYGYWHLERVDSLQNGQQKDLSENRIFWMFEGKLLEMSDYDGGYNIYLLRFSHSGGMLEVSQPYMYDRESGEGDRKVTDPQELSHYGINALEERFEVEKLSDGKMILKNQLVKLYFTKF